MPHELPLLINIAVALSYALVGGLIARRVGLPPIAGYLLAGVAMGPFTPGYVGDPHSIGQLAELGVIFLMFGVGLHFSFKDLWQVRDIAIPGAVIQMIAATALGYWLTRSWGWAPPASLLLGVAISVASTVVLLRGLMDHGLLETPHGRVAVGWLVLEDIATVLILVLLPVFAGTSEQSGVRTAATAIGKAGLFVALMLVIGNRAVPWLLQRVVRTRSRELFILMALTVALGTALLSAAAFGVSLALGAFVAGVVVSESPYSHQVGADLLPFREAFAVLFFVSVGMLVNPAYLAAHWVEVLELSALVVIGKALIASLAGFLFPHPARTALVVAAGLSQIGEFSFIVGQAGLALGMLDESQYSLILAGAIVSITVNPLMFRAIGPVERWLQRTPLWKRIDRHGPAAAGQPDALRDHVVIVGLGRVGRHITELLGRLEVPRLVVESNPGVADRLSADGVATLFGDAANSEILQHAGLTRARALVVTVPDQATTEIIVAAAQQLAPDLHIIARAATREGAKHLAALGASEIVLPELEAGVQVLRRTLLLLGFPIRQVQDYAEAIRRDEFPEEASGGADFRMLDQLVSATNDLELGWATVAPDSIVTGLSLADVNLRSRCGVSVVAITRLGEVITNPGPDIVLRAGDRVALIGMPSQIEAGEQLLQGSGPGGH